MPDIVNGMILKNYDQKQCQQRNNQKETLNINQKIKKEEIKKDKKQQFAND